MNDIGLKSYQDIQEPERVTDESCSLLPHEWIRQRDIEMERIFEHVLYLQRELEIQLWFEWSPHVSAVNVSTYNEDAMWHSDRDNKVYFIVSTDYLDEDMDPGEWADTIIDKLDKWADKFYEENS